MSCAFSSTDKAFCFCSFAGNELVVEISDEEDLFQCMICKKQFSNHLGLQLHYNNQHTLKDKEKLVKYKCPKCPREYFHKCSLVYHLTNECGIPPRFQCSYCHFRSNHKKYLKIHEFKHLAFK